jgi:hypothetical protein
MRYFSYIYSTNTERILTAQIIKFFHIFFNQNF